MAEFVLPDLGEGLTEAEIVRWLVSVGDSVRTDQPVVEVETAKATVELPVPFTGVVTELHGQPGETVPVGAVLITVNTTSGPQSATSTAPAPASAAGSPEAATAEEPNGRVLVGYGSAEVATGERPARRTPHVAVISPLVRRIARER